MDEAQPIPYGYCHCGCGERTTIAQYTVPSRGRVKGEPLRYVKGHQWRLSGPEHEERDCGYETPCWVWLRGTDDNGYGFLQRAGRFLYAHRMVYERHKGTIPKGLVLDHLCRNPSCVNPDHLEPVTQAENIRRGVAPPAINARKTHCIRGHEYTPETTALNPRGQRSCRTCRKLARQKRHE